MSAARTGLQAGAGRTRLGARIGCELAEAAGAFVLVLAGCGAIMTDALTGEPGAAGIAAAFGLAIGAMVYAVGHVSGAHFNPAVTLAFAATGHFPWRRVSAYIAAQVAGAAAAAACLLWVLGDVADLGATAPSQHVTGPGLYAVEFLLTATLMFVIASVATDARASGTSAGIAIGGTVGLAALWAGPLTGASMNPARSVGPALLAGEWAHLAAYVVAPVAGAVAGAFLYGAVRRGRSPTVDASGAAEAKASTGRADDPYAAEVPS